jgi:radical SAM/Cys-rich protein
MNDFEKITRQAQPEGLTCDDLHTLQINLGRYCNLSCTHCHLECSPLRKELMTEPVMQSILDLLGQERFALVDITGGAPELHPRFCDFVDKVYRSGHLVQVRTNLAALMELGLPEITRFFSERQIRLVASLPCYLKENVEAQRGSDVYDRCIEVIRSLNEAGYGMEEGLELTLAYNPVGPYLPPSQKTLEADYLDELKTRFDIFFSRLIVLTNIPIGRFRQQLENRGELQGYMQMLMDTYNPQTVSGLMCRHQICVDWDGTLFDCDFNLALGMPVNHGAPCRINEFDPAVLKNRQIVSGNHCFGCTAGTGSSCSGNLVNPGNPICHREFK